MAMAKFLDRMVGATFSPTFLMTIPQRCPLGCVTEIQLAYKAQSYCSVLNHNASFIRRALWFTSTKKASQHNLSYSEDGQSSRLSKNSCNVTASS